MPVAATMGVMATPSSALPWRWPVSMERRSNWSLFTPKPPRSSSRPAWLTQYEDIDPHRAYRALASEEAWIGSGHDDRSTGMR